MQSDLKRQFGKKIQALREARGLTQEQLAERIRRSVDTVSNVERGVNSTRIETAQQLAVVLGVRLPDLFESDYDLEDSARDRKQALDAILSTLGDADAETLVRLRPLIEVGLRLSRSER